MGNSNRNAFLCFIVCTVEVSVVTQPRKQIKRKSGSALFTCLVRGYPLPSVWWKQNEQIITSTGDGRVKVSSTTRDNNTTVLVFLNITAVTRGDNGTYVCEASNVVGDVEQQSTLLVQGMEISCSTNKKNVYNNKNTNSSFALQICFRRTICTCNYLSNRLFLFLVVFQTWAEHRTINVLR